MSLRVKYFLFVGLVHGVLLLLSFQFLKDNKVYFLLAEALILVSILVAWRLYRDFIRPLKLLLDGAEAIRAQDFNTKFLNTGRREMDELISVFNAMMGRLREERLWLHEQHLFLNKLMEASPTGILLLDFDGKIAQINPSALDFLNIEKPACLGKSLAEAAENAEPDSLLFQIANFPISQFPISSSTWKVHRAHFMDRGFQRPFLLIEDLSADILRAEKKAYGKVIRMMAHEVNNTIGPVNSLLESSQKFGGQFEPAELAEALEVAIDRNQRLNRFMRNFADVVRLPSPHREHFDLHALLRSLARLWQAEAARHGISIELALTESVFPLHADPAQLEQVLVNVLKNAVEAIKGEWGLGNGDWGREQGRGRIFIETSANPPKLAIRDTGPGIPAEAERQLFSPFFSTKTEGQGIGLTLMREILSNHGYRFSLRNHPDGGAVFEVVFT